MPSPSATSTPTQLLSLALSPDHTISLVFNIWLLLALLVVPVIFLLWRNRAYFWNADTFEIDKAEIGIGTGKISLKPNSADRQIAYAIWVELSTRKIGLQIDPKHDVISEIYDSWYTFFSVTRDLIKDIPATKLTNRSTREIVQLSIDVLNNGLRPHLTLWQARFRGWYDRQLKKIEDEDVDPQTLQARYPQFEELEQDLLAVNARLMRYRAKMAELIPLALANASEPNV